MTQENENYIQSVNNWLKSQTVLIEQIEISAKYNGDMIQSHTKALVLNNETIELETKAIYDVIDGAKKWCTENGIDHSVLKID